MNNRKKTIALCSSASHYKKMLEIEKELVKIGYKVKVPKSSRVMQRTGNFDINYYKTWYKDKKDYFKKTEYIRDHINKIIKSDAILVTNYEKNGIPGYIGGNVSIEMAIAFHYKKPIFILNGISEELNIKEEIYGLKSIIIYGNLNKIRVK